MSREAVSVSELLHRFALLRQLRSIEDNASSDWECVTRQGWTLMHLAAEVGDAELVSALIKYGVPVDSLDFKEDTPAMLAVMNNFPQVTELLLLHGAVMSPGKKSGRSLLHCAVRHNSTECVKLLLRFGVQLNQKTKKYRETPLLTCVRCETVENIPLLVYYGADLKAKGKFGDVMKRAKKRPNVAFALQTGIRMKKVEEAKYEGLLCEEAGKPVVKCTARLDASGIFVKTKSKRKSILSKKEKRQILWTHDIALSKTQTEVVLNNVRIDELNSDSTHVKGTGTLRLTPDREVIDSLYTVLRIHLERSNEAWRPTQRIATIIAGCERFCSGGVDEYVVRCVEVTDMIAAYMQHSAPDDAFRATVLAAIEKVDSMRNALCKLINDRNSLEQECKSIKVLLAMREEALERESARAIAYEEHETLQQLSTRREHILLQKKVVGDVLNSLANCKEFISVMAEDNKNFSELPKDFLLFRQCEPERLKTMSRKVSRKHSEELYTPPPRGISEEEKNPWDSMNLDDLFQDFDDPQSAASSPDASRSVSYSQTVDFENQIMKMTPDNSRTSQPSAPVLEEGVEETLSPDKMDILELEIEEANLCVVCMDNKRNHLFLPCKHLCLCGECKALKRWVTCPICNEAATDLFEIYNP